MVDNEEKSSDYDYEVSNFPFLSEGFEKLYNSFAVYNSIDGSRLDFKSKNHNCLIFLTETFYFFAELFIHVNCQGYSPMKEQPL